MKKQRRSLCASVAPLRGRAIEALEPRVLLANSPETVGTSFLAAKISDSRFIPPDSVGDVGPTQVLVAVNGRIRVFDKSGVLGGLNETTDTFFASVRSDSTSDPHVRYDRLSGRWFVTMIDIATVNRVVIAVSKSSTITGHSSFNFFQFRQDQASPTGNSNSFADYDTLGVDRFALYIGVNEFSNSSGALSTTAFVVNKANLLAGTLTVTAFRNIGGSSSMFTPQGVDNDDPNATEGYFIGTKDSGSSGTILTIRRVINPGGATPTMSSTINVTVPTYTHPVNQVARSSSIKLDGLDTRLFAAQITRNKLTGALTLWTAHSFQVNSSGTPVTSGGRNASGWYEIGNLTTTPTLLQSGTVFDSAASNPLGYWVPSVAANGQGAMALGASVAGTNMFASIAVAGRLGTDPLNTTQPPTIALTSTTAYNIETGVSSQRWGDFSQTVVDPTDDMTMWTFQEYCDATNSWGVRAIKLIALPPATPSGSSVTSIDAGTSNVSVTITGDVVNGSGFFDPGSDAGGPGFANHIGAVVNGGGVTVNSVTFTDPTHITLNLSVAGNASGGSRTITVINPDGQAATSASGLIAIIPGSGAIAGQVYQDNNGNGVFDSATEPFINGVSVFLDLDNNGSLNGTEPSVITSGNGNYSFSSLASGAYTVRQIVPAGYVQIPPASRTPNVASGATATGQDFGNFPVVFNGGDGDDSYSISLDTGGAIEQISDGSTTYTIDRNLLTTLSFNGNGGDDSLTVNAANGSPVPSGGVTFDGGSNGTADSLAIVGGASAESATFDAGAVSFGGTIGAASVESFSFDGGGGNDTLSVNSGVVVLAATQVLESLSIASGALVKLASGGGKVIKTHSLLAGGTLDLTDNAMILDYTGPTQLPAVLTLIGAGRAPDVNNTPTWTGPGITSSAAAGDPASFALGAIDNTPVIYDTFFSQPVDATSVLVRFTVNGDANLDGAADTRDFAQLATNFSQASQTWGGGDFNFDGAVNALDFNTLATHFGQSLPLPSPPVGATLFNSDVLVGSSNPLKDLLADALASA